MKNLVVALVQQIITPNAPEENLARYAAALALMNKKVDLIVLPEVFTTGFCASARQYAEVVGGRAYQWMQEQAQLYDAVVTGSLVVKRGDDYVNRLVWMRPDGTYVHYDKRHLFRMAGEHKRYAMGKERVLVELNSWRVANWPSARALHWNRLLQARAIENLSYVIGVNRVGMDEAGQHYAGDSSVYGPVGELIITNQETDVLVAELSAEHLHEYREKFPAHLDADNFDLRD